MQTLTWILRQSTRLKNVRCSTSCALTGFHSRKACGLSQTISTGPVGTIAETLTPLLAAMRIVWAISRYYGSDERMAALLQRVAHAILDRCKEAVNVKVDSVVRVGLATGQKYQLLCSTPWP